MFDSSQGGSSCFACGDALVPVSLTVDDGDDEDENDESAGDDDSQTQTYSYDDLDAWTDLAFVSLDEESEYYSMQVFRKYHGPVADVGQEIGLEPPRILRPTCELPTLELPTWEVTREGCQSGIAAIEEPVKASLNSAVHAIDHTVEAFVGLFLPLQPEKPSSREPTTVIIQALRPRVEVEDEGDGSIVYSTTEKLSIPRFVTVVGKDDGEELSRGAWWWLRKAPAASKPRELARTRPILTFWRRRRKDPPAPSPLVAKKAKPKEPPRAIRLKAILGQSDRSDDDSRSLGSLTTKRSWNLTETSRFGRAAVAPSSRPGEPEPSRIGLQIFAPVHVSKSLVYLDEIPPPENLRTLPSAQPVTVVHADESSYHSFVEPVEAGGRYVTEEEKTVTDGESSIHTIRILRVPTENLIETSCSTNSGWNGSRSRSGGSQSPRGVSVRRGSGNASSQSPRGVSVRKRSGSVNSQSPRGVSVRNRSGKTSDGKLVQRNRSREELLLPTLLQSDNELQGRQYFTEEERTVTDGDSSIHMIRIQRVPTDMRRKPSKKESRPFR